MAKVQRNQEETLTARHGDTIFIGPEGVEVIPKENYSEEVYYEEEQPRFEQEHYKESNDQEIVAQPGDTIIIEGGNVRIER